MASTKAVTVISNDVTLTAAGGETTSSVGTIDDGYGVELYIKVTTTGDGTTNGIPVQIDCSPDNSHWYAFGGALLSGTAASTAYSWCIEIPPGVEYVRTRATADADYNTTLRVEYSEITALS